MLLGDEDVLESKVNEGIQLMKRDAERRRENGDGCAVGGGIASIGGGGGQSSDKCALVTKNNIINDDEMTVTCMGRYSSEVFV